MSDDEMNVDEGTSRYCASAVANYNFQGSQLLPVVLSGEEAEAFRIPVCVLSIQCGEARQ
jgi:hypothetical protein